MNRDKLHILATFLILCMAVLACNTSKVSEVFGPQNTAPVVEEILPTETAAVTEPLPASDDESLAPDESDAPDEPGMIEENTIRINPIDDAALLYIPEGKFYMGTGIRWEGMPASSNDDPNALEHEMPSHRLFIDAFWFYRTHITNAQFAKFVDATGYQTTAETVGYSYLLNPNGEWASLAGMNWLAPEGPGSDLAGLEEHPVVHVTWSDAAAYCEWAGGRLPTEAEWERVANGHRAGWQKYPWGGHLPTGERANFCDVNCPFDFANTKQNDGYDRTSPVGSYPLGVGPFEAMDMAGNVWEWIYDWFDEDYYLDSPHENPTGPASGTYKVIRGGGWTSNNFDMRVTNRGYADPEYSSFVYGFRCVQTD
jgi:formylglycine-generating enzyme required for sulfatase activity